MTSLIIRRIRDMVVVLVFVTTAMFFILHSIPGSPAIAILGQEASAEQIAALNHELGFDKPLLAQYLSFMGHAFRGDLGYSVSQSGGVMHAVLSYLGPTLLIATSATVLGVLVAVPLAVRTVSRPRSLLSRFLMGASSFGLAIPSFWLALILVLLLAVRTRVFPVTGYVSPLESPARAASFLALPIIVIMAHQVALLVITLRESLAAEMLNPYVRTARAKGASERRVMYRHVLPNGLLPAVTVIGGNFGSLLGGVVIIETVFLIPGIGYLLYGGVQARDYNLILGITIITAALIVLVNLAVDLVYAVLDPRVRLQ
ncbi:ABC transporter permease [Aeromicrobium sp. 9AM]|uniref:ABC transporter permease n=1 Tax=Aeromicrobium sp. 9AM TaxID=2653126 RepID=UPI0012F4770F|nr:ABC transporter permease [Aeromicrobium sp. 9AM]VXB74459.1 Peptide/nickel transport system permease protein [Aeromicrobium sp. 9AM]